MAHILIIKMSLNKALLGVNLGLQIKHQLGNFL